MVMPINPEPARPAVFTPTVGAFYTVDHAGFKAEAYAERKIIVLTLAGSADAIAASHVQLMLTRLHLEARRHGTQEVTVDFRLLEFMVSSCFKGFLTWITKVRDLDEPSRYRIRFLSDAKHLWQRRSLPSLQAFSRQLVTIEFDIKFTE